MAGVCIAAAATESANNERRRQEVFNADSLQKQVEDALSARTPNFFQASIPANQRGLVQARGIYRCHHLDTNQKCQMNDVSFYIRERYERSTTDPVNPRLRKKIVQGFQQTHVIDRFAEQVQNLQTQQVADIVHIGMT